MLAALEQLAETVAAAFGAPACSIALLDDAQEHLRYVAAAGEPGDAIVGTVLPVSRGIAGFVAQTGEPILVSDVARDPRFARDVAIATGYLPRAIATAPVRLDGEVRGVLQVLDATDGTLELLAHFADLAGAIVANLSQTSLPEDLNTVVQRLRGAGEDERATAAKLVSTFLDHTSSR